MEHTKETIAGAKLVIYKKSVSPAKLTFLLPGACISLDEYNTILKTLVLEKNHVVVGFYINVLYPFKNNHRTKAQQVVQIFDSFKQRFPFEFEKYNLVGHSVGAKISLLVASVYDVKRVDNVIALDPVDQNPPCFTNAEHEQNESLLGIQANNMIITNSGGGPGICKDHNAEAIWNKSKMDTVLLLRHADASHMAYCDNGGGKLSRFIMPGGTLVSNRAALDDVVNAILDTF